jgi:hypothetical protein
MNNKIKKVDSTRTPRQARSYGGPATAGIEYDTGRDALVIAPDANTVAQASRLNKVYPATFFKTYVLAGVLPATGTNYGAFFTAPYGVTVVSIRERHGTATTSGTLDIKKAPSGTSLAGGTSVLSGTISTAGAADTNVSGSLSATAANRALAAGDSLGAVAGGTLTNGANMVITVELRRTPDVA